jgi:hypothetical protein
VLRAPQEAEVTKRRRHELIERLIMELQQRVVNVEAIAEERKKEIDKLKFDSKHLRQQEMLMEIEENQIEIQRLRAKVQLLMTSTITTTKNSTIGVFKSPPTRPMSASIHGRKITSTSTTTTTTSSSSRSSSSSNLTCSKSSTRIGRVLRLPHATTTTSSTSTMRTKEENDQQQQEEKQQILIQKSSKSSSIKKEKAIEAEYLKQVRLAQLLAECEIEENLSIRAKREAIALATREAKAKAAMTTTTDFALFPVSPSPVQALASDLLHHQKKEKEQVPRKGSSEEPILLDEKSSIMETNHFEDDLCDTMQHTIEIAEQALRNVTARLESHGAATTIQHFWRVQEKRQQHKDTKEKDDFVIDNHRDDEDFEVEEEDDVKAPKPKVHLKSQLGSKAEEGEDDFLLENDEHEEEEEEEEELLPVIAPHVPVINKSNTLYDKVEETLYEKIDQIENAIQEKSIQIEEKRAHMVEEVQSVASSINHAVETVAEDIEYVMDQAASKIQRLYKRSNHSKKASMVLLSSSQGQELRSKDEAAEQKWCRMESSDTIVDAKPATCIQDQDISPPLESQHNKKINDSADDTAATKIQRHWKQREQQTTKKDAAPLKQPVINKVEEQTSSSASLKIMEETESTSIVPQKNTVKLENDRARKIQSVWRKKKQPKTSHIDASSNLESHCKTDEREVSENDSQLFSSQTGSKSNSESGSGSESESLWSDEEDSHSSEDSGFESVS